MKLYEKFLEGGIPHYLARHYWWAYLWEKGIRFFDRQAVINTILLGQYQNLLETTLAQVETKPGAKLLQLTCVYGKLTPTLLQHTHNDVHLCDVAPAQLLLARSKAADVVGRCYLARMNAEALAYCDNAFDQVVVFFLFHELPPEARQHVYDEIARVIKLGGSVLITEYAASPKRHMLYRFWPTRWVLGTLEPFLPEFWQEDVCGKLDMALGQRGKRLAGTHRVEYCFAEFYRVMRFDVV